MRFVPLGPQHLQWSIPSCRKPTGQPQIREADHVVRVQVGEKDAVNFPPGHIDLVESLKGAAARVEDEFLPTCFDEDARPESVHNGRRASRAQECNLDFLPLDGCCRDKGEGK